MRGGARVRSGDDGAGATRKQVRWRGDGVAGGNGGGCAAKGGMGGGSALQRGAWGGGWRRGTHAGGHG
jgi:hypothetical protein